MSGKLSKDQVLESYVAHAKGTVSTQAGQVPFPPSFCAYGPVFPPSQKIRLLDFAKGYDLQRVADSLPFRQ